MKQKRLASRMLLAAAASLVSVPTGAARAADKDDAPVLRERVDRLEAEVRELRAALARSAAANATAAPAPAPAPAAPVAGGTSAAVIHDADRRGHLFAETGGLLAGWQKGGFFIRSDDDRYLLQPYFKFQLRYVANLGEFENHPDYDRADGFEVRRLEIGFRGHVLTPDLKYDFRWQTDRETGELVQENALLQYKFADAWSVKFGQWKDNVWHEETTSSGKQFAVDRSFLNETIGGGETDYVQGIALVYKTEPVQGEFAVHDGRRSRNTGWQDADDVNFGASARLEYKVFGKWSAYEDFSTVGNKEDLLVFGAGADWSQQGDTNFIYHTVDAHYEVGPLSLNAAYVGRFTRASGDAEDDALDWGLLAQAGWMLNTRWEVFGRYDVTLFDADQVNGEDTVHEVTAGLNYFVDQHNAKITLDAVWLPSGAPENHTNIGVLGQTNDDSQFILRAQFQLLL